MTSNEDESIIREKFIKGGIMKAESSTGGLGLYPIIFMVIFIRRYFTGMDISNVHEWIAIAISSFFWFIGIIAVLIVIFLVVSVIVAIRN